MLKPVDCKIVPKRILRDALPRRNDIICDLGVGRLYNSLKHFQDSCHTFLPSSTGIWKAPEESFLSAGFPTTHSVLLEPSSMDRWHSAFSPSTGVHIRVQNHEAGKLRFREQTPSMETAPLLIRLTHLRANFLQTNSSSREDATLVDGDQDPWPSQVVLWRLDDAASQGGTACR